MDTDEAAFDRAMRRLRAFMAVLTVAGALAAAGLRGWDWGIGFLAGAAVSLVNFSWLHQLVASLGPGGRRPSRWLFALLSLRYLLLGLAGYVIVRYFGLNLTAAILGLFVAAAAVIVEIFYELVHGRA
ncbi:MAG: ATP synthase subunit I [Bryobacterales bacterium]|nr:ATP synthase subunit I [Bryobacteraceae bacterium]MDW8354401.1 ATP synthase subunit I [Bryobacterales bacterium]